jgi:hypothetical protein
MANWPAVVVSSELGALDDLALHFQACSRSVLEAALLQGHLGVERTHISGVCTTHATITRSAPEAQGPRYG